MKGCEEARRQPLAYPGLYSSTPVLSDAAQVLEWVNRVCSFELQVLGGAGRRTDMIYHNFVLGGAGRRTDMIYHNFVLGGAGRRTDMIYHNFVHGYFSLTSSMPICTAMNAPLLPTPALQQLGRRGGGGGGGGGGGEGGREVNMRL